VLNRLRNKSSNISSSTLDGQAVVLASSAELSTDRFAGDVIAQLIDRYGAEATGVVEAIVQSRIPGYYPHLHRRYFVRRLESVFSRPSDKRAQAAMAMLQRIASHVKAGEVEMA